MKKKKEAKIKFKQKLKFKKINLSLIYIITAICILYKILFLINTAISSKDYFSLFGISFFNMENNLMEKDISKNDLVIVKEIEEKKIEVGDIIAYEVHGQIKINKIFNIENGEYTTKYNKGYYIDIEKPNYNQIIGKVVINIPFLGIIIEILQKRIVTLIVVMILFLLYNYYIYKYDKKLERNRKKRRIEKNINK